MIDIVDIYEAMHLAAKKASQYSSKYNILTLQAEQDAHRIQRHKLPSQRTPGNYAFILKETKENNMDLQDAGNKYKYWRDEQIRLSSLLQGELAFKQLVDNRTSWKNTL